MSDPKSYTDLKRQHAEGGTGLAQAVGQVEKQFLGANKMVLQAGPAIENAVDAEVRYRRNPDRKELLKQYMEAQGKVDEQLRNKAKSPEELDLARKIAADIQGQQVRMTLSMDNEQAGTPTVYRADVESEIGPHHKTEVRTETGPNTGGGKFRKPQAPVAP